MKKKLNLLWNLKFNFFSVAERPLTFFAYFLNAKKVGRRRLVISPAKAGAFRFFHTRLPLSPRRLLPFGRISLRETGLAGHRPHLLELPRKIGRGISLREIPLCGRLLRGPGFAVPHRCFAVVAFCSFRARMLASSFSTRFLLRKNRRSRLPAPLGPMFWPAPLSLCSSAVPRPKPRPSSFSIRFFLRKNRRARPPVFGRRGVDKVRKYHFVCVVLSSAPLTLSPLYAPARPVFRNRPKEKAAAENRCGCGISFTFPVFPPMRNKIPRMLCHSHPFNFALIPWGKQKRKARPLSFLALLRKAHLCPFCILSFLCRSRSRYRKVDSYSYFAIWYSSSTASCSEPVCFSIK